MIFPDVYDYKIYLQYNEDLKNMNDIEAKNHLEKFGINEGRICSEIFNRSSLLSFIPDDLKCLEIGPFDSPVLKKNNVKYFDILSSEKLKERAYRINRIDNINNIPFIDYVSKKGDLTVIKEKFDIVLSCHSIEHQLNFIQHLNDIYNLLNENGYYVIILPDKRYCFDHFINETTIADIINMNYEKRNKHSIKSVIEHRALTCHNDAIKHWNNDHGKSSIEINKNCLKDSINEYENNEYIDVHSLQFTPKSMKTILILLKDLNYINFSEIKIYNTIKNRSEFFVILKK